jgi:hypothetical protein
VEGREVVPAAPIRRRVALGGLVAVVLAVLLLGARRATNA